MTREEALQAIADAAEELAQATEAEQTAFLAMREATEAHLLASERQRAARQAFNEASSALVDLSLAV